MPFLFVDYDQGAGGEKFCAGLAKSMQCEDIKSVCYPNGRTKVYDVFDQEFLKPKPKIDLIKPHKMLYTIVPTHRHTSLAKQLLQDVQSIRIKMPQDELLYQHVINQRINKVLLTHEPTPEYFFGLVKILVKQVGNDDFVKKINIKMKTLEILMIAEGIDVTVDNIAEYLDKLKKTRYAEPVFEYDLVLAYEDLVRDPERVRSQLKTKFDIDVMGDWLKSYALT
jgi:hypothetical protein